jgi:hypothetical protein
MTDRNAMFDRFSLQVPQHIVDAVPDRGPADDAIGFHVYNSTIIDQLDSIGADRIRAELRQWGAWDDDELAHERENRERLLWLAVMNIKETDDSPDVAA